jgi:hypothetical protein
MKGLNYLKGRDDPVALPEEEYPEWLWRCLDAKFKEEEDGGGIGDEFCELFCPSYVTGLSFHPASLQHNISYHLHKI